MFLYCACAEISMSLYKSTVAAFYNAVIAKHLAALVMCVTKVIAASVWACLLTKVSNKRACEYGSISLHDQRMSIFFCESENMRNGLMAACLSNILNLVRIFLFDTEAVAYFRVK